MRGNPGSERSQRAPGCAVGVPGVPPQPPRYLRDAAGRPSGCGSASSTARGWGGQRRCEGSRFPAPGQWRTFSTSPEETLEKKKKEPSPSRFRLAVLFLLLPGWRTKSKTFHIRMWPHTVPHSAPSSGALETALSRLRTVKERNNEAKTFIL